MSDSYIFIDLDGTLLDVSEKFYTTYKDILVEHHFTYLHKELYWELKRNKTPENEIQKLTGAFIEDFGNKRKQIIESSAYQMLDTLQPGCIEKLRVLKTKAKLFVVTLRHSREQLLWQLQHLGILDFFDVILNAPDDRKQKFTIKSDLILEHFKGEIPRNAIFIGDTETDILAGKHFGYQTIGVLSGMRNYSLMQSYLPDSIIPSIRDLNI